MSGDEREEEREKWRGGKRERRRERERIIYAISSPVHHVAVCSFLGAAATMEQSQSKSA